MIYPFRCLTQQCELDNLNGVKAVIKAYPNLITLLQESSSMVHWIYYHQPNRAILTFLYVNCGMKNDFKTLRLLIMSAPVLELKDFVIHLTYLI